MQTIKFKAHGRNRQRGAALVLTLVAIAIASLLAAAIASLVLSHNNRARSDQDALKALYAADAALNYQTQRIFATTGLTQVGYNSVTPNVEAATYGLRASPIPVTGKTVNGTATTLNAPSFLNLTGSTDYCRCWIEYPTDPTTLLDLTTASAVYVYGQASVNGAVRTVRAKAGANGLFDKWAVFTNGVMDVGGSLSVTPLTGSTLGIVGSNTFIDISKDTDSVGGQVIYGTGVPDPDFPYTTGGKAVELTSINELATAAYLAGGYASTGQTGIAKFSANNDNLTLGTFSQGQNNTVAMPANGNPGSYPLRIQGKTQVTGQPQKVANFYLTRLDGSGVTIWADVSRGPINLWVNNTATNNQADDSLQGNVDIVAYSAWDTANNRPLQTLNDAKKFHIYYSNQAGSLRITGGGSTGNIFAMLYAYNTFSTAPTVAGTIDVAGSVTVNGAAYMQTLTGTGNFQVNYPTNVSIADGAGILFGLQTPWQEYNPVQGN
ncbi:MAG: hypothetical protein V4671_13430 [Armatimonadota bacterium]